MKKLFYGDNLQILREQIANEWADFIYFDPPFNLKANAYGVASRVKADGQFFRPSVK